MVSIRVIFDGTVSFVGKAAMSLAGTITGSRVRSLTHKTRCAGRTTSRFAYQSPSRPVDESGDSPGAAFIRASSFAVARRVNTAFLYHQWGRVGSLPEVTQGLLQGRGQIPAAIKATRMDERQGFARKGQIPLAAVPEE
jgi:hypothetical protein